MTDFLYLVAVSIRIRGQTVNKQIAVMINKYAKMLTQIDDSQLAKYKVLVRVDGVFYETEGDLAGAFTIRENAGDRLRQIYPVEEIGRAHV